MTTAPYYADESVTLYHGDADGTLGGPPLLATLPTAGFQAIITDPPYNVSTRNGRDGTTVGTLKRPDGTARKVQRNFGNWDHTWDPSPFLAEAEQLLAPGGGVSWPSPLSSLWMPTFARASTTAT